MSDQPDYIVDIPGLEEDSASGPARRSRPWIGVRFDCCGVYVRIYRNRARTAYEGRCPRCGQAVRARIGSGGTTSRFFIAD